MESPKIVIIVVGIVLAIVLSAIAITTMRALRAGAPGWLKRALISLAAVVVIVPLLLLPPFWAVWVILPFLVVESVRRYRATQQYALLWLLTVSAERSMPLAPAVAAFAQERSGEFRRRAQRLSEMLSAGVPLPDALERVRGLLPRHALSTIRVGCESGALAPALRQAAASYDLDGPIWTALLGRVFYLTLVPVFATFVLVFIMLRIVPAYQKIFADFGTDLPPMTQTLIGMADAYADYWYLFPFPLILVVLLVYLILRYWGWVEWDLPGVARLVRRFDAARVLDSLSLVARQQRPLPEGIATLAASYPKLDVRRRLRQTEADIRAGRDWCESLRRHDLLRPADSAVLQAAQRVGNLPWALQETAESKRRRLAYRVQAIIQVLFPLLVLVMGLMVAFVVISLFLPLITLIQRLAV